MLTDPPHEPDLGPSHYQSLQPLDPNVPREPLPFTPDNTQFRYFDDKAVMKKERTLNLQRNLLGGDRGGGSGDPQEEAVAEMTNSSDSDYAPCRLRKNKVKVREPELEPIKKQFCTFMHSVLIYFSANSRVYNTSKDKILFFLSYMTAGEPETWAQAYSEERITNHTGILESDINWGHIDDFTWSS